MFQPPARLSRAEGLLGRRYPDWACSRAPRKDHALSRKLFPQPVFQRVASRVSFPLFLRGLWLELCPELWQGLWPGLAPSRGSAPSRGPRQPQPSLVVSLWTAPWTAPSPELWVVARAPGLSRQPEQTAILREDCSIGRGCSKAAHWGGPALPRTSQILTAGPAATEVAIKLPVAYSVCSIPPNDGRVDSFQPGRVALPLAC